MSRPAFAVAAYRARGSKTPALVRKGREVVLVVPGADKATRVTFDSARTARRCVDYFGVLKVGDTAQARLRTAAIHAEAAITAARIRLHRGAFA